MAASLVVWQVKQREWAESHTWQTAVQQYMLYAPMRQASSFSNFLGIFFERMVVSGDVSWMLLTLVQGKQCNVSFR